MGKLPHKPSAPLRLALDDLEKAARDPRYEVNMGAWHDPMDDEAGKCAVCLAGAAMAGTLGADPDAYFAPEDFPECTGRLEALESLRCFDLEQALGEVGVDLDQEYRRLGNPRAPTSASGADGDDLELFLANHRILADFLEERGL